ncbi:uncharacterized protein [Eurosta solidaginis]|uniref:uncharacterized protein n=1 Tax=Eurosta solidaginis TaxID=178769 RepID=UPI003530D0F6
MMEQSKKLQQLHVNVISINISDAITYLNGDFEDLKVTLFCQLQIAKTIEFKPNNIKLNMSTAADDDDDMFVITEPSYAMFDNNDQHEFLLDLYRTKCAHIMLLAYVMSPYCLPEFQRLVIMIQNQSNTS